MVVLAVAAALLAAGCLGDEADPAEPTATPEADAAGTGASSAPANASADLARVDAPEWEPGQWFAYERTGPWTEGTGGQARLVVLEADGDGYRTGMDDRDALAVDLFWFNHPLLGPLDADLASKLPAEGNPPPRILDWPLQDGKTWTTQGYEDEWTVEARRVDEVDTGQGTYPGYAITANGTVGEAIEATYVPALETLASFEVHWTGEGDPEYALELADAGTSHEGPAWTGEPLAILHGAWTAEGLVPPQRTVEVPEAATDLYAVPTLWSPAGASAVALQDPDGGERYRATATPGSPVSELVTVEDPAAGAWTWDLATTGTQACGDAPAGAGCGGVFVRTVGMAIEELG